MAKTSLMLFVLVQVAQNDVASLDVVGWASRRSLTSDGLAKLVSAGRDVSNCYEETSKKNRKQTRRHHDDVRQRWFR